MSGIDMGTPSARWRRIAVKLVRHASRVLPGARPDWREALRCEIEYIEDDAAALRWALGCVAASYAARLAALAPWRWRVSPGPVVAASALLLIAMALQGHASDEVLPPVLDKTGCERPVVLPEIQRRDRTGPDPRSESDALCSHDERETIRNGRWNRNR